MNAPTKSAATIAAPKGEYSQFDRLFMMVGASVVGEPDATVVQKSCAS